MNSALNIFMGKGYTNMDGSVILNRGPVFPLMIASSYWLLGVSAWTAFWVVRIFCILNPIIIYFFGKRFFGKWVGFSASLLILTSYGMNFWSYRHIDAVWPFFTLVSILTIHLALENERYIYFVLSGILMGLAYLVKQAAILFLPLPLILTTVIGDYRRKKNLVGSIIFILTIFAFISPWLDYAYSHGKNIELALFGEVGRDESETTVNADILVFAKDYLLGLLAYYDKGSNSLSSNFSIAPLFICAWLFTIYRAIRGEKASVFFTVFLLLLSPYIAFVGLNNMRVGQLVIFLLITYLVTAGFCLAIMGKAAAANYGRLRISRKLIGYATGLVVIGLVVIQTFISNKKDKGNKVFFKRSYV
ncbi:MAG: glycosyltransferase family 39 protein, partial [Thermodesulfobacteriota bacterium]|nr:glycosyltransferase family 39 protein [Thermodesulfobacteriota bacterium]